MSTKRTMVRGIRGATVAKTNDSEEICRVTGELLKEMSIKNQLDTEMISAVFFSATPDLNKAFPAKAARKMGWQTVPLFCQVEIDVPEAIKHCIRILILVNTELAQDQIEHVYLKGTEILRKL
ncbi:MAG: chorismate mutase [Bacillota bacterium]